MDANRVLEALEGHVFQPGETVERQWIDPDSLALTTPRFRYEAQPAGWAVSGADWLAEAVRVMAVLEPVVVTHGFLFPRAGGTLHLNRPEVMAELGSRVGTGLSAVEYAELLAELYSAWEIDGPVVYPFSATESHRAGQLVRDVDHFSREVPAPGAPPVSAPSLEERPDGGWVLRFFSHNLYFLEIRSAVDVYEWEVTGAPDRPATWVRKTAAQRVELPLP